MFRLRWSTNDEASTLTVEGEMDATVIPQFLLAGRRAAPRDGGFLSVDLAQVTYMDAQSALAFIELGKLLERRRVVLQVENASADVDKLFTSLSLWPSLGRARRAA